MRLFVLFLFGARRLTQLSVLAPLKSLLGASTAEWRTDTLVEEPGDVLFIRTPQRSFTITWVDDLCTGLPTPNLRFTWSGLWLRPPPDVYCPPTSSLAMITSVALNTLGLYAQNPTVAGVPDAPATTDSLPTSDTDSLDLSSNYDSSSASITSAPLDP